MAADFDGVGQVVDGYKSASIETWAVFNRKNIMQAGSGEDMLQSYLDLLSSHGNNNNTYTLRMYRNAEAEEITDATACNSSFSFKVMGSDMGSFGMNRGGGNNFALLQKIAGLEQQLKNKEEKPEKSSVWEKLGTTVLGWLEDPDDVVKLVGAFKMITGKASAEEIRHIVPALSGVQPKRAAMAPPAAGLDEGPEDEDSLRDGLTEEQEAALLRYAYVIERGEKCDPDFLNHLEGVVELAETNPGMYQMALGFLKKK